MAVRVRVEIRCRASGASVVTAALVNSGYEVEEPEILLPKRLAEYLGLELKPPRTRIEAYETPLGIYHLLFTPRAVDVHLVDVSNIIEGVNVVVAEGEREVLISDKLAGALQIQILDLARGLWRYKHDPPELVRESVKPEYW
ncbi:MAG: hypothetical protein ABWW69_07865 [Pyrodictiaceae archaeon]